jgi:hypothetical protein
MASLNTQLLRLGLLSVLMTSRYARAGGAIYSDLLWSENNEALVIAQVVDDGPRVLNADHIGGNAFAVLEPLAVLAGQLDPSATPDIKVTFYQGPGARHIFNLPPKGSLVLAVVSDKNFIISDTCTFMPDGSPLVVLDGLGDRRILETIGRLRKVRLAPAPTQPSANTTRPAGKG